MVYPWIFSQNKRFQRECSQILSNIGRAHSLKRKMKKEKKKKKKISSYKND